jgi:hypothetical protein
MEMGYLDSIVRSVSRPSTCILHCSKGLTVVLKDMQWRCTCRNSRLLLSTISEPRTAKCSPRDIAQDRLHRWFAFDRRPYTVVSILSLANRVLLAPF